MVLKDYYDRNKMLFVEDILCVIEFNEPPFDLEGRFSDEVFAQWKAQSKEIARVAGYNV